jgi:hypothetical protein
MYVRVRLCTSVYVGRTLFHGHRNKKEKFHQVFLSLGTIRSA